MVNETKDVKNIKLLELFLEISPAPLLSVCVGINY